MTQARCEEWFRLKIKLVLHLMPQLIHSEKYITMTLVKLNLYFFILKPRNFNILQRSMTKSTVRKEVDAVCTCEQHQRACVSDQVEMRTLQMAPEGPMLLELTDLSSRSLRARWTAPPRPNGNLSYTLYYKSPGF